MGAGRRWVARRDFRHGGREIKRGEEVDLRTLTSERNAKLLINQRFLEEAPVDRTPVKPEPEDDNGLTPTELRALETQFPDDRYAQTTDELAEEQATRPPEDLDRDTARILAEDAGTYQITSVGGGWYDVVSPDGTSVNERGLRLPDAEALAERLVNKNG